MIVNQANLHGLTVGYRIEEVINEWDPLGFFPMAPIDEYSKEIQLIREYLDDNEKIQVEQLAVVINRIFITSFGGDVYEEDIKHCEEIAIKILG